jgi:hypothetical protein
LAVLLKKLLAGGLLHSDADWTVLGQVLMCLPQLQELKLMGLLGFPLLFESSISAH